MAPGFTGAPQDDLAAADPFHAYRTERTPTDLVCAWTVWDAKWCSALLLAGAAWPLVSPGRPAASGASTVWPWDLLSGYGAALPVFALLPWIAAVLVLGCRRVARDELRGVLELALGLSTLLTLSLLEFDPAVRFLGAPILLASVPLRLSALALLLATACVWAGNRLGAHFPSARLPRRLDALGALLLVAVLFAPLTQGEPHSQWAGRLLGIGALACGIAALACGIAALACGIAAASGGMRPRWRGRLLGRPGVASRTVVVCLPCVLTCGAFTAQGDVTWPRCMAAVKVGLTYSGAALLIVGGLSGWLAAALGRHASRSSAAAAARTGSTPGARQDAAGEAAAKPSRRQLVSSG